VYADAVINHMTGSGNDIVFHRNEQQNPDGTNICTTWGPKNGSAGSPFFTHGFIYTYHPTTNERYGLEFPAVPYTMEDFHCERKIRDWSSPRDLNFGWLASLSDLATEADTVRERIATFLVDMLSIGISGFRIDAAKHMAPDDIAAIIGTATRILV
jgi:alpha-amylase